MTRAADSVTDNLGRVWIALLVILECDKVGSLPSAAFAVHSGRKIEQMKTQSVRLGKQARREGAAPKKEVVFEILSKSGKRIGAVLIDRVGACFIDDGNHKPRAVSLFEAVREWLRLYKVLLADDDIELNAFEDLVVIGRWIEMIANSLPPCHVPQEVWKKFEDACTETGHKARELMLAGLQHVIDRTRAGQNIEREQPDPKQLRVLLHFEASFAQERNALLRCGDELYLADMINEEEVFHAGERATLERARPEFLTPCSVKEALAWYARCNPFASDSRGDIDEVCEMAAKALDTIDRSHTKN